jgi:hypothetical protein
MTHEMPDCTIDSAVADETGSAEANPSTMTPDRELPVGRVASVSGSQVVVLITDEHCGDPEDCKRTLRKGSLVKIRIEPFWVFGLVSSLSIPSPSPVADGSEMQFAEIAMLGEIDADGDSSRGIGFQRGVSFFPTVGDEVLLASQRDLTLVYAKPNRPAVRFGTIYQDQSIPAYALPDALLGRHFAIVGSTGTGKSCATALLLRRVLDYCPNGHVVLLDPHNEYGAAFPDLAVRIAASSLQLPFWLFSFEELAAAVLGIESRPDELVAESSILSEIIVKAKKQFPGNRERSKQITVDTPVPYHVGDALKMLDQDMGQLDKTDSVTPYLRIKNRLVCLSEDARYRFMFGGIMVHDSMASTLSGLFRVPVNGKPITILDLSGIPSDILNIVVSVISRLTFDFGQYAKGAVPILLVCEEAHRYIPADSRLGFEPTKRILSRIAKEGRKYGVSLCIVSQRPSDLALSALSQCNTILALRLTSQQDQDLVRGATPDWGEGLMDFLPSLRNAEAVVVGEGISVPARVRFDELADGERPSGGATSFSNAWQCGKDQTDLIQTVIKRWRSGSHDS